MVGKKLRSRALVPSERVVARRKDEFDRRGRATLARPQQKSNLWQALGQCRGATVRAAKKQASEKLREGRGEAV